MLSYLLDTHIYIWWRLGSSQLTREQLKALDHSEETGQSVGLSAISIWELAMLHAKGRIEVTLPLHVWLKQASTNPGVEILPMDADVCAESVSLPTGFHKDPADQIIVATARVHGLRLLTSDQRIIDWGKVPLI